MRTKPGSRLRSGLRLLPGLRFRPGLRLRVALSFALFSMLLTTAQTIAIFLVTYDKEEEFINAILADEMSELIARYRQDPRISRSHDSDLSGYIVSANERGTLPAYLQNLAIGHQEIFVDGKEFHVEVRKQDDAEFYLLYDASRHEQRIANFRTFLLLGMASMAAVTVGLGFWLSGLLVRQVADLAQRVAGRTPGIQYPPLASNYHDEEVVSVAQSFDEYDQRMRQLLQREKEFTANLSHELRTPLTAIVTSCELLGEDPTLSAKTRQRQEAIAGAGARIEQTMSALLLLARETQAGDDEAVDVREAIDEALAPFRDQLAAKNIEIELIIPNNSVLHVYRPALQLALTNLIKNAAKYTDRGAIKFRYDDGTLAISDTGRGIAASDLPHIFKRHYRGQDEYLGGSGLGLAIVRRIAERFSWDVSAESLPPRGSTFALRFPAKSRSA
ncbi:MAG: ATP-binding protein [Pseudomonadota bacterium]|nr:ATP-binding protein [Pseudomonadota bacterium]